MRPFCYFIFILLLAASALANAADEADNLPTKEHSVVAWSDVPVRVVISVTSRNGSTVLSTALIELARLAQNPRFSGVLSMSQSKVDAYQPCFDTARSDPSGRVFDLARCANIWPSRDKAPELKVIEKAFATSVKKKNVAAFPAVAVSTFEFQQRLKPAEIVHVVPKTYVKNREGKLEPTEQAKTLLCDPKVTFIEPDRCQVWLVPRLPMQQPDIYVSQTGYRMELLSTMPRQLAQQIGVAVRDRVEEGVKSTSGGVSDTPVVISIAPAKSTSKTSQVYSEASTIPQRMLT